MLSMPIARGRLHALLVVFCVLGIGIAPAQSQDACSQQAKPVTDIGRVMSSGMVVRPGELRPVNYNEPGQSYRYVRGLFVVTAPPAATWQLTIRDQQLRPIETFGSSQVSDGTARWTRRLDAHNTIYFDLVASTAEVRVELKKVVLMPESAEHPYYSLQNPGSYGFQPLENAPTGHRRLGDFAGFLMTSWGSRSWCCSGVVVGPDLFLTNWHCGGDESNMSAAGFWSKDVCENTIIDMSWDGDSVDREYICVDVVDKSEANDFAILRIRPLKGEDSLRKPAMRRLPVRDGEPVIIVQHPACRPKQVSLNCSVREANVVNWRGAGQTDFSHQCDTEGGSSGSPVFDGDNRLVGIHHLGFESKDGTCDKLNKAVRLQSIVESARPTVGDTLRAFME